MQTYLLRYGLHGILIFAAVEGDVTMILAGVLAHLGMVAFPAAVAAGAAGAWLSDGVWFAMGRAYASTVQQRPWFVHVRPLLEQLRARLGVGQLIAARFVYGTRIASMVFWGIQGLPVARFAAVDAIGCALWAAIFAGAGYAFSQSAESLIGRAKHLEQWLLAAVVAAVAVVIGLRGWARLRRR